MEGALRHQSSDTKRPVLRSIGRALPGNYYPQEILTTALWNEWSGKIGDSALFQYRGLDSFAKANDKWVERAVELGEQAVLSALGQAGPSPTDIDRKRRSKYRDAASR